MNKEIVGQLEKTLREKGNEIAISKNNLNRYTVNSVAFQQYPRDCYSSIEDALSEKLERGNGFSIGASFKGGGSVGDTSFSADFGITLSDNDILKLILCA